MNSVFGVHDASRFPTTGLVSLESYLVSFPGEFDLRGQIELSADSGLTLLYGRNGSGKSSILRAIKDGLSGIAPDSLEDPVCRLVLRLSDWDVEDPQDWYRKKELIGCRGFIRGLAQAVLRHERFGDGWEEGDYRIEFSRWEKYLSNLLLEGESLPDGWFSSAQAAIQTSTGQEVYESCIQFAMRNRSFLLAVPMIEDSIFMSAVGPMGEGDQQFEQTLRVIQLALDDSRLILTPSGTRESPSWETAIAIPNGGPDSDFGKILSSYVRVRNEYVAEHGPGLFEELEAFESGELPTALLRTSPMSEQWGHRLYPLFMVPDIEVTELPFTFVDGNQLPSVSELLNSQLSGSFPEFAAAWQLHGQGISLEKDNHDGGSVTQDDETEGAGNSDDDETPIIESDPENDNDPHIVSGPFGPIDLNTGSLTENLEVLQTFSKNLKESLHLLGSCDIRISPNPSLQLLSSLDDLRAGRFIALGFAEFPDLHGPFSVTFDQLSDGQQKLVNLAFAATSAVSDESGKAVILVGDEVDNGLHTRAVSGVYQMLGAMPISTLCSTHSIEAVAQCAGRRLHLRRDDATGMHLQDFEIRNAQVAARQIGVPVSSLIAFIRLIVIVEGEHDRLVLDALLASQNQTLSTDVLVLPIRGANNLMTALEAELLDYTDAMVLVVLDNVRQERVNAVYAAGLASSNGDEQGKKAILAARAKCESHEERIVGDIIVKRSMRGDLARIAISGLSKGDIIEYLDPKDFGLTKSFDQLRAKHSSLDSSDPMGRTSFKDYVRATEGVNLGIDDVRLAASNLQTIHPDLSAVLSLILNLLQRRSLQLGFGI